MFNLKKYFKKPEIEFDKPLTSDDVVRMFKEKNFYQLRKLIPQFNFGKRKLSRWQSLGVLAMGVLGLAVMPVHPVLGLMAFGLSLSFGSEAVFNSVNTLDMDVSALDSTHFVVAYRNEGGDRYGYCRVGTISDSTITFGSAYVFEESVAAYERVVAIDSTHFVVIYGGKAIIGTVSNGDEIAYGNQYYFDSVSNGREEIALLDSTHFVVAYEYNNSGSYSGRAIIGTIDGTTISYGTAVQFGIDYIQYMRVTALDATHFVIGYADTDNNTYGTTIVGVVSDGDTITFGSKYVVSTDEKIWNSAVTALDSTHFVFCYHMGGAIDEWRATIGVVSSGNHISYGLEYKFRSIFAGGSVDMTTLDSTHFVIAYRRYGSYGTAILGTVDGTTISFGTDEDFNTGDMIRVSISALDSTHFVIAYRDDDNSDYGTAIHGTYSPPAVAPTVTTQAVTNIGATTATGNGNITDDGNATATRGMCWATHSNPTTSDNHATNGTGEGAYTVQMTGLSPGTHYYVRAYSTNSAGTSYGSEVEFDTKMAGNAIFFGANF